mmetsp:Transcript_4537/g.9862  ORF Transcript_4537/g.9862 Transcript_4537/m.9862 type:complete len:202 (-) Transcript_4537:177-782(-)
MAGRRPMLASLLLAIAACNVGSWLFVNTFPAATQRGSRVAARVSAGYLERLGPKDTDTPFNAASAVPGMDVEFKKRPFGILRYQPGQGGKGAMAMEIIPTSRYPGDPQGQAFSAGVKGGMVITSINGMPMANEDFGKIMDLLDDEVADPRFSKSTAVALEAQGGRLAEPLDFPITVNFGTVPGYVYQGKELTADGQDGFAR